MTTQTLTITELVKQEQFNGKDAWDFRDAEGRYWKVWEFARLAEAIQERLGQAVEYDTSEKEKPKKDGTGTWVSRTIYGMPGVVEKQPRAGASLDLTPIVPILTRIAEALEALAQKSGGAPVSRPHVEEPAGSSSPAGGVAPPPPSAGDSSGPSEGGEIAESLIEAVQKKKPPKAARAFIEQLTKEYPDLSEGSPGYLAAMERLSAA